MAKLFERYLIEEVGIAETRAPEIAEAYDKLHSALCQLDTENLSKVHQRTIGGLMRDFSVIEEVKEVMPSFEGSKHEV